VVRVDQFADRRRDRLGYIIGHGGSSLPSMKSPLREIVWSANLAQ
jgi:hypothetical protein